MTDTHRPTIATAPPGWVAVVIFTETDSADSPLVREEYPVAGWAALGYGRYEVEPFWYEPGNGVTFLSEYDHSANGIVTIVGPGQDSTTAEELATEDLKDKMRQRTPEAS